MTYGMLIDLRRCVGCRACSTACKGANGTRPGVLRSWVTTEIEGSYPATSVFYLPRLCNHCDSPACVEVCPTGASVKQDNGVVTINKEECIGCGSCQTACPYGARYLVAGNQGYFDNGLNEFESKKYEMHPEKTVDKCDFCMSRTRDGETPAPACAAACPADARIFGDIDELRAQTNDREAFEIPVDVDLGPNVLYLADFKL